jgi:hypothetical protein
VSRPDAGRVLRRALVAWGLGHLALGRTTAGRWLLVTELGAIGLLGWLVAGLADTSAYLVPYLAGVLFLVAWAWQAIDAHRLAREREPARSEPVPSGAVAIGWLAVPLLVWGAGFWLVGAADATPAAVLDRFVVAWTADGLDDDRWPSDVVREARDAADMLGGGAARFRDVRIRIVEEDGRSAVAIAESVHFERRRTAVLGIFPGSELVPVADDVVLRLELVADDVPLPGGGEIGAVRWSIVEARASD